MYCSRLAAIAVVSFCAINSTTSAARAASSAEECLEQGEELFVGEFVRATFGTDPLARYDGVAADARDVVWRLRKPQSGTGAARYGVAFNGSGNCWLGGKITGTGRSSSTAPSALALGVGYATRDTEVRSLTVARTLHGVWAGPEASDVRLTDILLSQVIDSCIVAEQQGDLTVDNVFLHKCGRVFDLRSEAAGSLTISNSLIRINDGSKVRGRGRLFGSGALDSQAAVYFEGNTVVTKSRLDANSLAVIEGNCRDNTLIWVGAGDYPGELPACFTVVQDKSAWRSARLAWLQQHASALAALEQPAAMATTCSVPSVPQQVGSTKKVGSGSAGSCSESALRNALKGGGTIAFSCGSTAVTIPIRSELVVSSNTVIDGGGRVTLDGENRVRIIRNNAQLTLKRITLKRGLANVTWSGSPNGGGAVNSTYGKRLYVIDSTFRDNQTSTQGFGGAIFQAGNGLLTVVRTRFENNIGGGGGAVYSLLAGLRVTNSAFVRNRGTSGWHGGGGIMSDGASARSGSGGSGGEIAVCGTSFEANSAIAGGAGAYLYAYGSDRINVAKSTFASNTVTANSGGVSSGGGLRLGPAPTVISESTFRRNSARTGGAIAASGRATTRVQNSLFECNSSNISGAKVSSSGNTFRGC